MSTKDLSDNKVERRLGVIRFTHTIARHWLVLFIILFGIYNALPFAAPIAMRFGWTSIGNAIYWLYSTQCHQMAQRSFFLFSDRLMYNVDELPLEVANRSLVDISSLRAFRGDATFGWKVAWSDRMVYMYGSLWITSVFYWYLPRHRPRRLFSLRVGFLLILPLAIDGTTHLLSDFNGPAAGFRYDNQWLAALTNYSLPDSFYTGDSLGSFNAVMRLITGILFGIAIAGITLPLLDGEFRRIAALLWNKLNRYYAGSPVSLEGYS